MRVTYPGTAFVGSSHNLTCTVELSSAIDVPVIVNTVWTGPAGTVFTPNNSVTATMESVKRYISTAMFNEVGNNTHTCTVHINSTSRYITESGVVSRVLAINVGKV